MNSGPIQTWNLNPADVGPLYPFVGWEGVMTVIAVALWLGFHVWHYRKETADLRNMRAEITNPPRS